MRSNRLRGHSLNDARQRLIGYRNYLPFAGPDLPKLEKDATDRQPLPISAGGQKLPKKLQHHWYNWNKKQKIAAVFASLLILGGALAAVYIKSLQRTVEPPIEILRVQAEPPPKTVASPLTGVQVTPRQASRPVTAIMIENSLDARPQSGLQEAGVVFEAIAEGGITRFVTLFQESSPQYVGPVRSLRPYYIDFAVPFDAGIAHVGGSPDALAQIRGGGKDLDQFFNAGTYWRVSSRRAPHNVYTSFEKLDALNQKKGYTSAKFTSWPRKVDKALATPTAKTINVAISSALYNSRYDYDAASNSYLRSEGGKPHISTSSEADGAGQQLKPKTVVVLVMPYSTSGKYSVYGVNGSGAALVFQDGGVTQGTWSKADRGSQFEFKDSAGQPLPLNAGQTWVTVVAAANKVTYNP